MHVHNMTDRVKLLFTNACEHVHWRGNRVPQTLYLFPSCVLIVLAHSHKSSQSSISLSGCAAPTLRWGRWGRPCPPLYWSVGGSSAAPPPWTGWPVVGCLSAQPPPHRHALPEYWPTGSRRREMFNKDMKEERLTTPQWRSHLSSSAQRFHSIGCQKSNTFPENNLSKMSICIITPSDLKCCSPGLCTLVHQNINSNKSNYDYN